VRQPEFAPNWDALLTGLPSPRAADSLP